MRALVAILLCYSIFANAQLWEVKNHPNNAKKAIVFNGKQITDFIYSEVSELSEGKAYVAKGGLYAYIDTSGKELTPYFFAVANNFTNGFAIAGDSTHQTILNSKMHVVVPFGYAEARLPKHGLIIVRSHEGLWGAYDTQGNLKLPLEYDLAPNVISREKIIVRKLERYGVVNDCNEILFNCYYQYITSAGFGYKKGKYLRLF